MIGGMNCSLTKIELLAIYQDLLQQIGPRHWWPADSPFEVIIGAILTQNTAWQNVKKAIANLKDKELLNPSALAEIPEPELAALIRPSGYFNQKAKKIKIFSAYFVNRYQGSMAVMAQQETAILRQELLALFGIGPETADSMLLYALAKPIFVVDAYTRRIFSRHGWFATDFTYQQMQEFFIQGLPQEVSLLNEFHALIDYVGHHYCRKQPICQSCPLQTRLPLREEAK